MLKRIERDMLARRLWTQWNSECRYRRFIEKGACLSSLERTESDGCVRATLLHDAFDHVYHGRKVLCARFVLLFVVRVSLCNLHFY
jgi:hypothetical protein